MPAGRRSTLYAAAFHGPPGAVLQLPGLVDRSQPAGRLPLDRRSRWLAGVCLGALGRYESARRVLEPDGSPASSLAASARASHLRQLGRHAEAEPLDALALHTAGGVAEARGDALVGLVADAVGGLDLPLARRRLAAAAAELRAGGSAGRRPAWRAEVRLGWVRAEVALLAGDPASAVAAADQAHFRSRTARGLRGMPPSRY